MPFDVYDACVRMAGEAGLTRSVNNHNADRLRLLDWVQVVDRAVWLGGKLPPHGEMAERWGVSRSVASRWMRANEADAVALADRLGLEFPTQDKAPPMGTVYWAQLDGHALVKVGWTTQDVAARLAQLEGSWTLRYEHYGRQQHEAALHGVLRPAGVSMDDERLPYRTREVFEEGAAMSVAHLVRDVGWSWVCQ